MGTTKYSDATSFEEMAEQDAPVTESKPVTPEPPKVETNETTE